MSLCKLLQLCFNFIPFVFTIVSLRAAVYHLFALGKSTDNAKNVWNAQPLMERVLLLGVAGECQPRAKEEKYLRIMYWLVIAIHILRLLQWVESFHTTRFDAILLCSALIKLFLLDIPIIVCCANIKLYEDEDNQQNAE